MVATGTRLGPYEVLARPARRRPARGAALPHHRVAGRGDAAGADRAWRPHRQPVGGAGDPDQPGTGGGPRKRDHPSRPQARGRLHHDRRHRQDPRLRAGQAEAAGHGGATATTAVAQESETATGVAVGTIGYMAPEQLRGLAVDQRTDVFAFGCLLYEMVSGQRAFQGETAADILSANPVKRSPAVVVQSRGVAAGARRDRRAMSREASWRPV